MCDPTLVRMSTKIRSLMSTEPKKSGQRRSTNWTTAARQCNRRVSIPVPPACIAMTAPLTEPLAQTFERLKMWTGLKQVVQKTKNLFLCLLGYWESERSNDCFLFLPEHYFAPSKHGSLKVKAMCDSDESTLRIGSGSGCGHESLVVQSYCACWLLVRFAISAGLNRAGY